MNNFSKIYSQDDLKSLATKCVQNMTQEQADQMLKNISNDLGYEIKAPQKPENLAQIPEEQKVDVYDISDLPEGCNEMYILDDKSNE